jgi:hypothetical protein
VQHHIEGGIEMILGLERHPELGMFILVGLGGIWTEVLDDVAVRPIGLRKGEAEVMIRSLRGYRLLDGARGSVGDVASVVRAIELLDCIGRRFGDAIQSVDVNPLIVTQSKAIVVDAVFVIGTRSDVSSSETKSGNEVFDGERDRW